MFLADKLIFLELHKTGSTHIRQLLSKYVGGQVDGKHNAPSAEMLEAGKPFLGSIRNPWSWYVSLWTYGCEKKGLLYQRLNQPKRWEVVAEKRAGKGKDAPRPPEGASAERANFWYADPMNPDAFREWMRVVFSPGCRQLLEPGYGGSPLGKAGGLMTFRYFRLFVKDTQKVPPKYKTLDMLKQLDAERCFIDHFIKTESLEADLINALAACGIALTEAQVAEMLATRKTNTSTRPLSTKDYYDAETAALVGEHEKFITDKFSYSNPF